MQTQPTTEMTFRVVLLSILLSVVLAASNTFLALKIGLLTSASIPAAVISMGILRLFKNSNIFENNLVQTAASAGEAIAGGIVYTIPGLVIIQYWNGFNYWENVCIALIGGVLGVMFSIPLRRVMMNDKTLRFPEGHAIAAVLKISNYEKLGINAIVYGGLFGSLLEFCQTGLKLFADSAQCWVQTKRTILGVGVGFSPVMIGAGYLIGIGLAASIFTGTVIGWFILVPIFSHLYPDYLQSSSSATQIAQQLFGDKIRYVGIGAMLSAGLITFGTLLSPFMQSIAISLKAFRGIPAEKTPLDLTDLDMPIQLVLAISAFFIVALFFLYQTLFPVSALGLSPAWSHGLTYAGLIYSVVIGFIFCAITAYFSGMVGVTASPGSAIVVGGLLIAAILLFALLHHQGDGTFSALQMKACEAIVIMCASIITGMAAISNDNMQDLKVGHLIGATPWKQQVMLLLGVLSASLTIPFVMQKLYLVYGIAGVMPRMGMDPSLSLPAPPAAAMAMLSVAVFQQNIPWNMMLLGGGIIVLVVILNFMLKNRGMKLSMLGVAMGLYLPFATSTALFIGGLIAWSLKRRNKTAKHQDTMLACGLIAGPALLDVLLAIPFSIMQNGDALNMAPAYWSPYSIALSLFSTMIIYRWFKKL